MEFSTNKKTIGVGQYAKTVTCARREIKTYTTTTTSRKLNISSFASSVSPKSLHKRRVSFDHMTLLNAAIRESSLEDAKSALSNLSLYSLNAISNSGVAPIHLACLESTYEIVELLLKKGVNSSVKDADEWTPLHIACHSNALDIVKLLLEYEADPLVLNLDEESPIDLTENEEIKDILNRHDKATINENFEATLLSCLKTAVKENRVESFLKTIDISDQGTLLHLSAAYGFKKLARYILESGLIEVDTMDDEKWTPLHAAYYWENDDIISLLIQYNANPDLVTKDYFSVNDLKKEK